ncbi:MAG TPA: VTT domain-containing protein [Candidatus Thermoplasmatota archaeon]|nr:VTT domain-containing protein [Candidatus Thermoplasmatota archaeon]
MADPDVGGIFALVLRYGYVIVAIAGLAEALPLLGWLVPGQAIIIVAGAAAAAGYLDPRVLILVTIPSGILGDAIGFYVGRRYGRAFLEKYGPRLRIGPKHLARSDALFAKYGAFALIVARFSFLTRAVGPILGGMSRMRSTVFWPINVLGAVAWSVSYTLLGYSLGVGFLALQAEVGKILAFTLLAVVGLYVFYRVLRKYASQFTRDDLYVAIVGGAAGALFGILADRVQKLGAANVLDANAAAVHALFAPLSGAFRVVELATSFPVLGSVSLGLALFFFSRRRWWDATLVAMGVGGIILLVGSLRPIFRALLPPGPGESFPSASAAIPLVLAGVLTYLAAWRMPRRRATWITALIGATVASAALFSRLGQGREYPSAVLAGLALGTAWLCVTVLVVEFRLKRDPAPGRGGSPP